MSSIVPNTSSESNFNLYIMYTRRTVRKFSKFGLRPLLTTAVLFNLPMSNLCLFQRAIKGSCFSNFGCLGTRISTHLNRKTNGQSLALFFLFFSSKKAHSRVLAGKISLAAFNEFATFSFREGLKSTSFTWPGRQTLCRPPTP